MAMSLLMAALRVASAAMRSRPASGPDLSGLEWHSVAPWSEAKFLAGHPGAVPAATVAAALAEQGSPLLPAFRRAWAACEARYPGLPVWVRRS